MWTTKEKKPLKEYLLWAYGIAWASELFLFLGEHSGLLSGIVGMVITYVVIAMGAGMAPTYAMYIVLKRHGQITGIKDFFRRILHTPKVSTSIAALLLAIVGLVILNALNNTYTGFGQTWYIMLFILPIMLVAMVFGGGMEEVGWRGFMQPALEETMPFPAAALVGGLIWAVWHYPLWLLEGANQSQMNILSFTVYCILLSFGFSLLFRITKSVWVCVVAHAVANLLGGIFSLELLIHPLSTTAALSYICGIAAVIILYFLTCHTFKNKQHSQPKE